MPEELKEERRARLMQVQAGISAARLRGKVGKRVKVLVDAPGVGRSSADAPDIDGVVNFSGRGNPGIGEFVQVMIERSDEHDLYGRLA